MRREMWTAGCLLLAGSLLACPEQVALAADGRIERREEFLARVDGAITRGVEWLRSREGADGWTALTYGQDVAFGP